MEHNENQPLIGCGEKLGHPTLAAASVVTLTGAGSLLDTVQEALQVIRVMLIKVTGSISHRPIKRDHFKTVLDFGPRSPRSKQTTYCRRSLGLRTNQYYHIDFTVNRTAI